MRLLLDENVPCGFIKSLKNSNNVEHVLKKCKGKTDFEILKYAVKNKRTIVTLDSDFCDFRNKEHYGIIKINGKIQEPTIVLLELINIIKDKDVKNIYFQIDCDKAYKEEKVYSKKKHKFKQYKRTPIFLKSLNK